MLPFFAPVVVGPFRTTDPVRTAVGGGDELSLSASARGDFGRAPLPFVPAVRKGEPVRLTVGGVPTRDGGLLGRLMAGLSHEEKKSSSGSPAGVVAPSLLAPVPMSETTTSSGYLYSSQQMEAKE